MVVDLRDMKPSSRSLTGINGASETMIGTIKLPVYACGVTPTIKFLVIRTSAPYNAILGTPWLHSMKAICAYSFQDPAAKYKPFEETSRPHAAY